MDGGEEEWRARPLTAAGGCSTVYLNIRRSAVAAGDVMRGGSRGYVVRKAVAVDV